MLTVLARETAQRTAGVLKLPVVELFGPTIQGEGPDAGVPAYFVRFGGCDYRCTWCDSMHAVEPAAVRANAERLSVEQIVERLDALAAGPDLVVLSGGNPALLELGPLVRALKRDSKRVAVETQGSRWRDWLNTVDRLVISPKPPSSSMAEPKHLAELREFMARLTDGPSPALKIVVFDAADLEWALERHREHPELSLFLSAGTDVGLSEQGTFEAVRERFRWLCETVSSRPDLRHARVLPQLHVIAWGTVQGV